MKKRFKTKLSQILWRKHNKNVSSFTSIQQNDIPIRVVRKRTPPFFHGLSLPQYLQWGYTVNSRPLSSYQRKGNFFWSHGNWWAHDRSSFYHHQCSRECLNLAISVNNAFFLWTVTRNVVTNSREILNHVEILTSHKVVSSFCEKDGFVFYSFIFAWNVILQTAF